MKILFLSDNFPPDSRGGADIIAYADARALATRGHEITVITTKQAGMGGKSGFKNSIVKMHGMTIHSIFSDYADRWRAYKSLNNKPVVREVSRIIESFGPDVVHAHNIHAHISYASLKAAKKSGAKVFITFHDAMAVHYGKIFPSDKYLAVDSRAYKVSAFKQLMQYKFRYNPLRNLIIKRYLRYTDGLFAVSDALKRALGVNGIGDVQVLHNGVDPSIWDTDQKKVSAFKSAYKFDGKKVVLFGGRISAAKGSNVLLMAFKIVLETIKDTVLLVAGPADSPGALSMKEFAKEYSIADKVIFTGWMGPNDVRHAFGSADVVTVLSLYLDPFPTINLEAMASGRPVVGTRLGGTPEIVVDGKTGYVVDPLDIKSVADRILRLLLDPREAWMFGEAGRKLVAKEFSLTGHIDNLLACYNS